MAVRTTPERVEPDLLGIPAAAGFLRVPPSEVIRKIFSGAFPGAERGEDGRWRIPRADLEALSSGVFGVHRVRADLAALDAWRRARPAVRPEPRRLFSGAAAGWGPTQTELQRLARERKDTG